MRVTFTNDQAFHFRNGEAIDGVLVKSLLRMLADLQVKLSSCFIVEIHTVSTFFSFLYNIANEQCRSDVRSNINDGM